jgi:hypothetical protein
MHAAERAYIRLFSKNSSCGGSGWVVKVHREEGAMAQSLSDRKI